MYCAPEQESSNNYDIKADIYSLGIILYEILNNFKTKHSKIKEILNLKKNGKVNNFFKEKHEI